MLAKRQLARAPASSSSLMMATRMLATPYHHQQRGYATPKGPPPQNFRTSKQVEWVWEKDSLLDRLGKYFLMTEMARGMYVLLEQFFRPPYVYTGSGDLGFSLVTGRNKIADRRDAATPSTTHSKRYAGCAGDELDIHGEPPLAIELRLTLFLGPHFSPIPWRTRAETIPLR